MSEQGCNYVYTIMNCLSKKTVLEKKGDYTG